MLNTRIDSHRLQRTIADDVQLTGIGFLTGADVTIRFRPAPPNHGIVFRRRDLPGTPDIPALIEYAVPRRRRTAIARGAAVVEMTEHVLAALAGLQVDNCVVELDAPEPPGCDGSSLAFAECLLETEFVEQNAPRPCVHVARPVTVTGDDEESELVVRPLSRRSLAIGYHLDYGPRSPIPPQNLTVEITTETFLAELAYARTFILESDVEALRAQGYGRRTTARDLLVFGPNGIVDNELRDPDECARHKILDCLGDFALIGCDLAGHFSAYRSGHCVNRETIRRLRHASAESSNADDRCAA